MTLLKYSTDSLYSMTKGKINLELLKDTILMPPPKRPSRSLHSITSDDFPIHSFFDVFMYTSSENTIVTTSSQNNSIKRHKFLQKKHSCLQDTAISECSDEESDNKSRTKTDKRIINLTKFKKLPCPSSTKQIEQFVQNLLDYMTTINIINSTLITLKAKLLTRLEDFHQNGLDKDYFIHSLISMQNELIAMICLDNDGLIIDSN